MAIVRSMTSKSQEHSLATSIGLTGFAPGGSFPHPAWLSVCAHELVEDESVWPAFVALGQPASVGYSSVGGGFLGPRFDPLPCPGNGKPPQGLPINEADALTVRRRDALRDRLGADFKNGHDEARLAGHANAFRQLDGLLDRRGMFDLSRAPIKQVAGYGNTPLGRDCLLAGRLVEQGVPFILVSSDKLDWDLHVAKDGQQSQVTSVFDTAVGALLDELIARGLWEHTLVVLMGEFGRTPRATRGDRTGRDHWSKCWSMSFGGAGVKGGVVVGATTADGTNVKDRPVTIPDLLVTFYQALGIDPRKEVDVQGRPTAFLERGVGKPIREVL
jgi:hypothetical protein